MRFTAELSLILLLILMVAPASAQTTYDLGLKNAIEKNDITICNTIDQRRLAQDYVVSVAEAQEECRINFIITQKNSDQCKALSNTPALGSISSRHQCLKHLANILQQPGLCEQIASQNPGIDMSVYRDSCRAGAITNPKQCSEGFHTAKQSDALKDRTRCIEQIARNKKDESMCQLLESERDKLACHQTVKAVKAGSGFRGP
jgi:hypothetical protein